MKKCDAPNPAFQRLAAALSPPVLTDPFSRGALPQPLEGEHVGMTCRRGTSGELLMAADPGPREATPPVASGPTLGLTGVPLAPLMTAHPSPETGGPPTILTASHPSSTAGLPLTMLHEPRAQATASTPLPPLPSLSLLSRNMLPPPAGVTISHKDQQPTTTETALPASHVTHPHGRGGAQSDSPAAATAAAAAAAEAAASDAAEQLLACQSLHHLTTSAPTASTAMSAAVSASTSNDTPAAAVNRGYDTAKPCRVSEIQTIPSVEGTQNDKSIGTPASYTAAATAVGHSCGTCPSSRACSADFAQHRLGRDASIAQVLASLNQLPTYSNPAQHPGLAQLGLVTHAELPQQVESAQHRLATHAELAQRRAESLPLQVPPLQAGCTQLSCGELTELPHANPATQPLKLTSLTQQLSPNRLSRSPQRAHVHAAQTHGLQGGTQVLGPSCHRAAHVAVLPSACDSQLLGVAGGAGVSLPEVKMSAHSGAVLGTALLQSPQGGAELLGYSSCTVYLLC